MVRRVQVAGAIASTLALGASAAEWIPLKAVAHIQGAGNAISGTVRFEAKDASTPVTVTVDVAGLDFDPTLPGVTYHIHTNPVKDGCASTFGHLDPLKLTDAVICNDKHPEFCQVGDLAGKWHKLPIQKSVSLTYTDPYLRFFPQKFSLLGRSVTFHGLNGARVACGSIISELDGTATKEGKATGQASTYVTEYPTAGSPPPTQKYDVVVNNGVATWNGQVLPRLPSVLEANNVALTTASGKPEVKKLDSFKYNGGGAATFPKDPAPGQAPGGSNPPRFHCKAPHKQAPRRL